MSVHGIYRKDVDGLRAIAVVSVIMYHLSLGGHALLPGGYLGVDIFFLISGFIVGSLIIHEIDQGGKFNFAAFCIRRIRRILPALYCVLFVSFILGWHLFLPFHFIEYATSQLCALFFIANFCFFEASVAYESTQSEFLPLLHTWSLSIEEQFYLVTPLALVILSKFGHRKRVVGVLLLGTLSLASMLYYNLFKTVDSFFLPQARAWELISGVLLAFYAPLNHEPKQRLYENFISSAAIIVLLACFVLFPDTSPYRSLLLPIPVIACAVVIIFSRQGTLVYKILTNKLMVWFGLISYSLYLWHYPVFSYLTTYHERWTFSKVPLEHSALAVMLTLGLATASYYYIERPFRNRDLTSTKFILSSIILSSLLIAALSLYIIYNNGIKNRFSDLQASTNLAIDLDNRMLGRKASGFEEVNSKPFTDEAKYNILIIGDSHARNLFNIFYPSYQNQSDKVDVSRLFHKMQRNSAPEAKKLQQLTRLKNDPSYKLADIVFIADSFHSDQLNYLDRLVEFLVQDQKLVVMTDLYNRYQTAREKITKLDQLVIRNYNNNKKSNFNKKRIVDLERKKFSQIKFATIDPINRIISEIAAKHDMPLLHHSDYQCVNTEKRCFLLTDLREKIYYDSHHLTLEGASFFAQRIKELNWGKPYLPDFD